MENVKIGDAVVMVAPSGSTIPVTVIDVIRGLDREPLALEVKGKGEPFTLPIEYFRMN